MSNLYIARLGKQNLIATALLALLLIFAPFYTQPNAGLSGLGLPYNIPQWAIAAWIIGYTFLLISQSKKLFLPTNYLFFLAFPVIVIASSLLADASEPITWLFRQLYILAGLFFLFSLFQFQLKQYHIERILYLFSFAMAMHAVIGILQINAPGQLFAWFPPSGDGVPRGMFEQINVHASYLATGMMVTLYLISRPSFRSTSFATKAILALSFGLSTYIVIYSGSRVGFFSIIMGLTLILFSRRQQLFAQKAMLLVLLISASSGFFMAQKGFEKTMNKTAQVTESEYSSARLSMYSIGLDLAIQKPFYGHGIGSFLRIWNLQAAKFLEKNPESTLPRYVNHPHNEALFWLIEGGASAFLGFLAATLGILIALFKCGFQRGGAYAAMILPIAFHTQVEHPFYISAVHWFLWLFLIFIALQHNQKQLSLPLSNSAAKLIQVTALLLSTGATYFMVHCDRSQSDLFSYMYNPQVKPPYLQIAYDNLYFRPLANKVATRSLFFANLNNNNREKVLAYLLWAENYVKGAPEPEIYSDIAKTATYLKTNKKACELVAEGAQMYPRYEELQEATELCLINMKKH